MQVLTMTEAAKELENKGFKVTRDVIYQAIQCGAPNGSIEFGARRGFVQTDVRKLKTFCNWLVSEKRLPENPFSHVTLQNERADRRLERRALLIEEIGRLLRAALDGGVVQGMTGYVRSLLYRLAIETGLRSSEIHPQTTNPKLRPTSPKCRPRGRAFRLKSRPRS